MRIATWNIGEDERYNGGKVNLDSYDHVIDTIRNERIDIICLQEAIIKSDFLPAIATYVKENTDLKYCVEYELSSSHINLGASMGVVICSRYEIDDYKFFKLDNPNFVYSVDKETTHYSHDKGFIIASINDFNIITGHCLPFHVFKKDPSDYLELFRKADDEFLKYYYSNVKTVLCGDFNYDEVNILFPKMMENSIDLVDCPTRKDRKSDHFIISRKLDCIYKRIAYDVFNHKIGVFEIVIKKFR